MFKKIVSAILLPLILVAFFAPSSALAAAGIFPSGGGTKTVGQSFTVNVVASGAEFNAFQGTISVGGVATVTGFSAGSADTWMSKPSNGGTFSGALLGRKSTSLTIASITMKGNAAGKATVTVSNVMLKNGGTTVSNSGGTSTITIQKAPELPGAVTITSASHPDQAVSYEATNIDLSWNKTAGVDGFSYLLDQADGTTPPATVKDAAISASYANQAIGVYYFHIKAHKADGWGPVSQYKITIKEPDPKINESLPQALIAQVQRAENAVNDIDKGTLAGIEITGKTESAYTANVTFTPLLTLPEGKSLSVVAGVNGDFKLLLDFPLAAGFYKITVQGQKEKVLTPVSDPVSFEVSLKSGGSINLITATDAKLPAKVAAAPQVKGSFLKRQYPVMSYLIFTLILAFLILGIIELRIFMKKRRGNYSGRI